MCEAGLYGGLMLDANDIVTGFTRSVSAVGLCSLCHSKDTLTLRWITHFIFNGDYGNKAITSHQPPFLRDSVPLSLRGHFQYGGDVTSVFGHTCSNLCKVSTLIE